MPSATPERGRRATATAAAASALPPPRFRDERAAVERVREARRGYLLSREGGAASPDSGAVSPLGGRDAPPTPGGTRATHRVGYSGIVHLLGEANHAAMQELFAGCGAPPMGTDTDVVISFELFEAVQQRATATRDELERTKIEAVTHNQRAQRAMGEATQLAHRVEALEKQLADAGVRIAQLRQLNTDIAEERDRHEAQTEQEKARTSESLAQLETAKEELAQLSLRASDNLVALAQRDQLLATLRREKEELQERLAGHEAAREVRSDSDDGVSQRDQAERRASSPALRRLRSVAREVASSTHTAQLRLQVGELETERDELLTTLMTQRAAATALKRHQQRLLEGAARDAMALHDALSGHRCSGGAGTGGDGRRGWMRSEGCPRKHYTPGVLLEDLTDLIEVFRAFEIDAGSRYVGELDECRDSTVAIARASTESLRLLDRFSRYLAEAVSVQELKDRWGGIEQQWFGNIAAFCSMGFSNIVDAMVKLTERERRVMAAVTADAAAEWARHVAVEFVKRVPMHAVGCQTDPGDVRSVDVQCGPSFFTDFNTQQSMTTHVRGLLHDKEAETWTDVDFKIPDWVMRLPVPPADLQAEPRQLFEALPGHLIAFHKLFVDLTRILKRRLQLKLTIADPSQFLRSLNITPTVVDAYEVVEFDQRALKALLAALVLGKDDATQRIAAHKNKAALYKVKRTIDAHEGAPHRRMNIVQRQETREYSRHRSQWEAAAADVGDDELLRAAIEEELSESSTTTTTTAAAAAAAVGNVPPTDEESDALLESFRTTPQSRSLSTVAVADATSPSAFIPEQVGRSRRGLSVTSSVGPSLGPLHKGHHAVKAAARSRMQSNASSSSSLASSLRASTHSSGGKLEASDEPTADDHAGKGGEAGTDRRPRKSLGNSMLSSSVVGTGGARSPMSPYIPSSNHTKVSDPDPTFAPLSAFQPQIPWQKTKHNANERHRRTSSFSGNDDSDSLADAEDGPEPRDSAGGQQASADDRAMSAVRTGDTDDSAIAVAAPPRRNKPRQMRHSLAVVPRPASAPPPDEIAFRDAGEGHHHTIDTAAQLTRAAAVASKEEHKSDSRIGAHRSREHSQRSTDRSALASPAERALVNERRSIDEAYERAVTTLGSTAGMLPRPPRQPWESAALLAASEQQQLKSQTRSASSNASIATASSDGTRRGGREGAARSGGGSVLYSRSPANSSLSATPVATPPTTALPSSCERPPVSASGAGVTIPQQMTTEPTAVSFAPEADHRGSASGSKLDDEAAPSHPTSASATASPHRELPNTDLIRTARADDGATSNRSALPSTGAARRSEGPLHTTALLERYDLRRREEKEAQQQQPLPRQAKDSAGVGKSQRVEGEEEGGEFCTLPAVANRNPREMPSVACAPESVAERVAAVEAARHRAPAIISAGIEASASAATTRRDQRATSHDDCGVGDAALAQAAVVKRVSPDRRAPTLRTEQRPRPRRTPATSPAASPAATPLPQLVHPGELIPLQGNGPSGGGGCSALSLSITGARVAVSPVPGFAHAPTASTAGRRVSPRSRSANAATLSVAADAAPHSGQQHQQQDRQGAGGALATGVQGVPLRFPSAKSQTHTITAAAGAGAGTRRPSNGGDVSVDLEVEGRASVQQQQHQPRANSSRTSPRKNLARPPSDGDADGDAAAGRGRHTRLGGAPAAGHESETGRQRLPLHGALSAEGALPRGGASNTTAAVAPSTALEAMLQSFALPPHLSAFGAGAIVGNRSDVAVVVARDGAGGLVSSGWPRGLTTDAAVLQARATALHPPATAPAFERERHAAKLTKRSSREALLLARGAQNVHPLQPSAPRGGSARVTTAPASPFGRHHHVRGTLSVDDVLRAASQSHPRNGGAQPARRRANAGSTPR